MPGKRFAHLTRGASLFNIRLGKLERLKLQAEADRTGTTPSAYARAALIMAFAWAGREENLGVRRTVLHRSLDRAIKNFILAYQMPVGVAGLPAKEKWDELEELSWQAVLEAQAR